MGTCGPWGGGVRDRGLSTRCRPCPHPGPMGAPTSFPRAATQALLGNRFLRLELRVRRGLLHGVSQRTRWGMPGLGRRPRWVGRGQQHPAEMLGAVPPRPAMEPRKKPAPRPPDLRLPASGTEDTPPVHEAWLTGASLPHWAPEGPAGAAHPPPGQTPSVPRGRSWSLAPPSRWGCGREVGEGTPRGLHQRQGSLVCGGSWRSGPLELAPGSGPLPHSLPGAPVCQASPSGECPRPGQGPRKAFTNHSSARTHRRGCRGALAVGGSTAPTCIPQADAPGGSEHTHLTSSAVTRTFTPPLRPGHRGAPSAHGRGSPSQGFVANM